MRHVAKLFVLTYQAQSKAGNAFRYLLVLVHVQCKALAQALKKVKSCHAQASDARTPDLHAFSKRSALKYALVPKKESGTSS